MMMSEIQSIVRRVKALQFHEAAEYLEGILPKQPDHSKKLSPTVSGREARWLIQELVKAGISQTQVSKAAGLSKSAVTEMFRRDMVMESTRDAILSVDISGLIVPEEMDEVVLHRILDGEVPSVENKGPYVRKLHQRGHTISAISVMMNMGYGRVKSLIDKKPGPTLEQLVLVQVSLQRDVAKQRVEVWRSAYESACYREEEWKALAEKRIEE